jgi:hypothetical protein
MTTVDIICTLQEIRLLKPKFAVKSIVLPSVLGLYLLQVQLL